MALGMVSGRFQFQRATKAEWEQSDIGLLDGEIAIESDTTKMKAGDGKTLYKDWPYITIGEMSFKELTEEEKAKVKGEKGDPFTYEDFTQKQLDELKGEKGDRGDALKFDDLTKEQLEALKGEKGEPGKGIVDSRTGKEIKIWSGNQEEFDSIDSKDSNTLYLIKE